MQSGQKSAVFILDITIFRDWIGLSPSIDQSLDKKFGNLPIYFGCVGVYADTNFCRIPFTVLPTYMVFHGTCF